MVDSYVISTIDLTLVLLCGRTFGLFALELTQQFLKIKNISFWMDSLAIVNVVTSSSSSNFFLKPLPQEL